MIPQALSSERRLIEAGFPCHQVGAETTRERDTGKAPPTHRLHVWWARRPLTPSRAAILGSLLPAGTDPAEFLMMLGIKKRVVRLNGAAWTLTGDLLAMIEHDRHGREVLPVDIKVLRRLEKEEERREVDRKTISQIQVRHAWTATNAGFDEWRRESQPLRPWPPTGALLRVEHVEANAAAVSELMQAAKTLGIRVPNIYGYDRAYKTTPPSATKQLTILDPTAGGGSIPFEGMRLGHRVIANDLNPVAAAILHATLSFPNDFGVGLADEIQDWGDRLLDALNCLDPLFARSNVLPDTERTLLIRHLVRCREWVAEYDAEEVMTYLFVRQVTCPHCGGEAPLLNSCWLAKPDEGERWGVRVVLDGRKRGGSAAFEPFRLGAGGRGPEGADPSLSTVADGVGTCLHCRQAIASDEIKRQARGESQHGRMIDRLYAIAAVRFQPKLDAHGQPRRYASGPKKGEIVVEKVRYFRKPNETDLAALDAAEAELRRRWPVWEEAGLIPTENIPDGSKTRELTRSGSTKWFHLFTPRQLLGHLILVEELNRLKPRILEELGEERGRAVVTYLQLAIDKGVDYNSRQTRWIPQRCSVSGTFGRHDYSFKWTFGEMVFAGPHSGAAWGLSQVVDAYRGIAELIERRPGAEPTPRPTILHGSAAHMPSVTDRSVDLVVMDPPYYDNVQYAELSDFYYVWQKRTLRHLYPDIYARRLVDKREEAVANPVRDGSDTAAKATYERLMGDIFAECRRVLKDEGAMTLMFTHKSQDAWETLTRSLIEAGWVITATVPVESEFASSTHQLDQAAAASSIFITCRKRAVDAGTVASWTGFGGGVRKRVREAVAVAIEAFRPLALNPVDEMVASYGRALQVLSEAWPVLDGDAPVSPVKAMNEAAAVVAQSQIARITRGRLKVEDLDAETAMALTLLGIFKLGELAYDEALNLSRSLGIALVAHGHGYTVEGRAIGINSDANGRARRAQGARADGQGYAAPLVRKNSKLRLALPEERDPRRLERPQTDWDRLHGLLAAYRHGDEVGARAYMQAKVGDAVGRVLDLLDVWAAEIGDETAKREAEALRFGLQAAAA